MRTIVRLGAVVAAGFAMHISALHAASERVVYSFGQNVGDGVLPAAGLINVGGTLYGTTTLGGAYGAGAVFSIDPASGAETVHYSFGASSGDARLPHAGLTSFKNILYGTTQGGGDRYSGAVFSFDPTTGTEAVLHSFGRHKDGKRDGAYPRASLVAAGDKLYGTTQFGGTGHCNGGCGTVFSIKPANGKETVLHSFQKDGADGMGPVASLVDVVGILYGTTASGGTGTCGTRDGGCGTVFSIDATAGVETVLHSFQGGADGAYPSAGLTNFNGLLYGTTGEGGSGTGVNGTVFSIDPSTGEESVVYSFNGEDGQQPDATLIKVGHTLYGTTYYGGKQRVGVVFAFKPATGIEKVLHSFSCCRGNDGADPWAPLVAVNGTLYGTTYSGGRIMGCPKKARCGTVFAVQLH